MMTAKQKESIDNLQRQGLSYRKIAEELKLSVSAVKSYCIRHPVEKVLTVCLKCGAPLTAVPHKREKRFCCDACRSAWWRLNPEKGKNRTRYHYVCPHCGMEFNSDKKDRVYCSRLCYAEARRKVVST